jgi:FkbM family methyltransferase
VSGIVRSGAWRLGRFLYRWARREGENRPQTNGEHWLLDRVLKGAESQPRILVDIGANWGEWSAEALRLMKRHGSRGEIHAFEPAEHAFAHLSGRFAVEPSVRLHPTALSDRTGEAELYVVGSISGRNSLHATDGADTRRVAVQSFDAFVREIGSPSIAMVKSDTEGHDFTVLAGALETLRAGLVDVWQFEYNHRWLANRASLLAVFEMIEDLPYELGKLYGRGIECYDRWHFELDRFIETNYVLVRKGSPIGELAEAVRFDARNVPR